MIARVVGIAVALAAGAAIWWGYSEIGQLRGTILWEYRYVVLLVGAIGALSLLDTLVERIGNRDD